MERWTKVSEQGQELKLFDDKSGTYLKAAVYTYPDRDGPGARGRLKIECA